MIGEVHLPVQHLERDEVPMAMREGLQKSERIPAKSYERGREGTVGSRGLKCLQLR